MNLLWTFGTDAQLTQCRTASTLTTWRTFQRLVLEDGRSPSNSLGEENLLMLRARLNRSGMNLSAARSDHRRPARPRLLELEPRLAPAVTFSGVSQIPLPSPGPIAVANLGNGHPDIVVADWDGGVDPGLIDTWMNDGNGNFTEVPVSTGYVHGPIALALAKFTGGSHPDIAVLNSPATNTSGGSPVKTRPDPTRPGGSCPRRRGPSRGRSGREAGEEGSGGLPVMSWGRSAGDHSAAAPKRGGKVSRRRAEHFLSVPECRVMSGFSLHFPITRSTM
jgi:hypothetical protein